MANSQDTPNSQRLDLLAAVVLHTLVTSGREGITSASIAVACERDPNRKTDMDEIEAALELLRNDGLAEYDDAAEHQDDRDHDGEDRLLWPTRAAVRASELSF